MSLHLIIISKSIEKSILPVINNIEGEDLWRLCVGSLGVLQLYLLSTCINFHNPVITILKYTKHQLTIMLKKHFVI